MAVPSLSGIQRRHERQGVELGEAEVADEVPEGASEMWSLHIGVGHIQRSLREYEEKDEVETCEERGDQPRLHGH